MCDWSSWIQQDTHNCSMRLLLGQLPIKLACCLMMNHQSRKSNIHEAVVFQSLLYTIPTTTTTPHLFSCVPNENRLHVKAGKKVIFAGEQLPLEKVQQGKHLFWVVLNRRTWYKHTHMMGKGIFNNNSPKDCANTFFCSTHNKDNYMLFLNHTHRSLQQNHNMLQLLQNLTYQRPSNHFLIHLGKK